jgi:two-component system chemotaxis response regulator CheB
VPKTRVLIVDDAVVMRRLVSSVLEQDPDLEVAGVAANGRLALAKIPQCNPDVVTLDVEMPEMDGLETVSHIRKLYPKLPIIMFSTLTRRGAAQTLDALARGATDYVAKPANVGSVSDAIERLREELIPKIKAHCRSAAAVLSESQPALAALRRLPPLAASALTRLRTGNYGPALAIGTSTGGPNALNLLIPALPADLGVPVLIVQHMPPVFTAMLAERLNSCSAIRVHEAAHGQRIEAGHAYIAPGGKHLEVASSKGDVVAQLHEGAPENSCRPAVDVLFRSVAAVYGAGSLAVVLTGMGQDGLRGSEALREAGGRVLVQDQKSSVVWGMPGSVARAGLADEIVELENMARAIRADLKGRVSGARL